MSYRQQTAYVVHAVKTYMAEHLVTGDEKGALESFVNENMDSLRKIDAAEQVLKTAAAHEHEQEQKQKDLQQAAEVIREAKAVEEVKVEHEAKVAREQPPAGEPAPAPAPAPESEKPEPPHHQQKKWRI
jgi:hypothetical protein